MDPISAISLAAAIIQFVDFGTKLLSGAHEIYYSTTGLTQDNASLAVVTQEMKTWSSKLRGSNPTSAKTPEEISLCRLATECEALCDEILKLVEKCHLTNSKSKLRVLGAAITATYYRKEKQHLCERLKECRSQLIAQLETMDRFGPLPLKFLLV